MTIDHACNYWQKKKKHKKRSFLVQTQDTLLSMLDGIVKFIFVIYWHFIQFNMFKLTVNVLKITGFSYN